MGTITRRNLMKTAAAGLAAPAIGPTRLRRRPLKIGFVYPGPDRRLGLDLGAQKGPQGDGRRAERSGRLRLCREREGRRKRDPDHEGPGPAGRQAHLHRPPSATWTRRSRPPSNCRTPSSSIAPVTRRADNVGLYNERFYEGRSVVGTIAGHMSKTGSDRLSRFVQDPRSRDGGERVHTCRRKRSTRRSQPSW